LLAGIKVFYVFCVVLGCVFVVFLIVGLRVFVWVVFGFVLFVVGVVLVFVVVFWLFLFV